MFIHSSLSLPESFGSMTGSLFAAAPPAALYLLFSAIFSFNSLDFLMPFYAPCLAPLIIALFVYALMFFPAPLTASKTKVEMYGGKSNLS